MLSASASTRVLRKIACAAANAGARSARRTSGRDVSAIEPLAGLRVGERDEAGRRHVLLARVPQVERDDVVPPAQDAERALVALGLEVGDDRHDAAALEHPLREPQRAGEVGAAALGLAGEQVAHDAQRVVAAPARRHVALDAVGEDDAADAVVVRDGREREHRGQLGCVLALAQVPRAELLGARHVDDEQEREVALLDELLHVRRAHAGGDVPVDRADLVAGSVLAHLGELHPAALEDGVVRPADPRLEDHLRADLDPPDAAERLGAQHVSAMDLEETKPTRTLVKGRESGGPSC